MMHRTWIFLLGLFAIIALLPSCGGNCGPIPFCFDVQKEHTKGEVINFHKEWSKNHQRYEPMGYMGSDATHHHYIARPIDWFVTFQIPKSQLKIKEERPLLKVPDSHYRVNPSENIWTAVDMQGKPLRQ